MKLGRIRHSEAKPSMYIIFSDYCNLLLILQESFGWVGDTKLDLQLAEATENLYFGSQDVASDLELLKQNHITHILNLAPNVQNPYPDDFKYLKLRVLDFPETDISQHFAQTNKFLAESLSSGARVYVHCNAGVSRSTTVVVAYIMMSQKIPVDDVLKRLKTIRPCVCPNKGFLKQLKDYEKKLNLA